MVSFQFPTVTALFVLPSLSHHCVSGQSCMKGDLAPLTAFHDSETSRSGTVTASGTYSSAYEPYHAFSSDDIFWISETWQDPAWIAYNFEDGATPTARTVHAYRFFFCNGPSLTTRAPKRFELQVFTEQDTSSMAKNFNEEEDGVWTAVDSRCCETNWNRCEERTYNLNLPATGTRFRILFHEDNDGRAPIVAISLRNIQFLASCNTTSTAVTEAAATTPYPTTPISMEPTFSPPSTMSTMASSENPMFAKAFKSSKHKKLPHSTETVSRPSCKATKSAKGKSSKNTKRGNRLFQSD